MTRFFLICFIMTSFVMIPMSITMAQDTEKTKEEIEALKEQNRKKVEAEIKKDTPITEWITSENALLDRLPKQNKQTFFILRNKHSVIRAIETVKSDVSGAVKVCGQENKNIKKTMDTRFKEWTNAIDPILKEAKKFLEIELKEQEAFHITDYRHITKLNDKAYKFSESQVQKTPVTTEAACKRLLDSMDRTEDNLINILQDVLLPEEVARKRSEQALEKRKEAEALKAKRKAEREVKEKVKSED